MIALRDFLIRSLTAVIACVTLGKPLAAQSGATHQTYRTDSLSIGETITINSEILHEARRINIYAPPGFHPMSTSVLPVLYMPDGGIAEDFLHVAGLVEVLVGNGTMRPFLLVGIENTERRRDMTGPTTVESDKNIATHVGGSAPFRAFIRRELMPVIKARYKTTGETAVIGESLAGLFVVETFFREPDLFDTYIAFDPSLWWNEERLLNEAPASLRDKRRGPKTLYLANSQEPQLAKETEQLASMLRDAAPRDLVWHYTPLPDETHGTIYHPAALRAFQTLFRPDSSQKR